MREIRAILRGSLSLLAAFSVLAATPSPAVAADPVLVSTASVCTANWGTDNISWKGAASRIYAPASASITSASIRYGNSSYNNSVKLSIYTNNAGAPGTHLGTLSYSSWDLASLTVTLTGSAINLPSSGTYWVQIGATSNQQNCYVNAANYTGSADGWTSSTGIYYGTAGSGYITTAWSAFGAPQNAYQFAFTLYGTQVGSGTVSMRAPTSVASYRTATSIIADLTGSGKITFFQNSKRIPGCINLSTSGSTATCMWKPLLHGAVRIHSVFTPTGGSAITSNVMTYRVNSRTNIR